MCPFVGEHQTFMPFYRNRVYPHLVRILGNPKPVQEIRQHLVPLAKGEVLEIGAGPGVNFAHYDPAKVSKVYALEPNPGMIPRAEEQRRLTQLNIEFLDLPGERIPLDDDSVDTVVSTFTMCTIPEINEAIRGVSRVLRPGGQFIFFSTVFRPMPMCDVGRSGRNRFSNGRSRDATSPATFHLSLGRAVSRLNS